MAGDMSKETQSFMLTLSSDVKDIIQTLTEFQKLAIHPKHVESRTSKLKEEEKDVINEDKMDYFIEFESPSVKITAELLKNLKNVTSDITVLSKAEDHREDPPWFPQHISDLYRCCTHLLKYGDMLTPDHPGYGDEGYIQRRKFIADLSINYKYGDEVPHVEYTEQETKTWGQVFRKLTQLYPTHACKEYNTQFPDLFSACNYREDNIPQLGDVSCYLKGKTGWQLWPVIGWISARDFLNTLAFRVFPTSQYMRHHSSPYYTPEPDLCHELMGHAPLFCDPYFAQFSQDIGLASLGISDKWIERLGSLYWFTIEFGMVREEEDAPKEGASSLGASSKVYGAGILSSYKELQHSATDAPIRHDLDIEKAVATSYPQSGLQPLYFVASSIKDMGNKLTDYSSVIPRDYEMTYDPQTQSVRAKKKII